MPETREKTSFLVTVYRILLVFVVILALIFLGGTVYGLLFREGDRAPQPEGVSGEQIFTGVGRLRLSTKGNASGPETPAMVILSVTFPYSPEDRAFSEELTARIRDFRTLAREYFGSVSAAELRNRPEDEIKGELLERFNGVLRLGKIRLLYFNDFMILDDL